MAKKARTGKTGSGSQSDKSPGGKSGDGGNTDTEEEKEEEEEEEETEEEDDSQTSEDDSETPDPKDSKGKRGQGDSDLDISKLPQAQQDYIRKLRRENAKHRTTNKNLQTALDETNQRIKKLAGGDEGDETPPEKRVEQLDQTAQSLSFDNAILQAAVTHGVGKDELKYFRFLVSEKVSELGEGEELDDEDLADLAKEAAGRSGKGKGARTSVGGNEDGSTKKSPDGKPGKITLEKFVTMTIGQKSELQRKDPDQYKALWNEAVKTRRFV